MLQLLFASKALPSGLPLPGALIAYTSLRISVGLRLAQLQLGLGAHIQADWVAVGDSSRDGCWG